MSFGFLQNSAHMNNRYCDHYHFCKTACVGIGQQ